VVQPATGGPLTAQPQFKIVDAPDHGTLNKTTGTWFTGPVTYAPTSVHHPADSFTFAARTSGEQFPTSPPTATVAIAAGPEAPPAPKPVAISGAPAELVAGTSAQLQADRASPGRPVRARSRRAGSSPRRPTRAR
jgi:hypothetical protein